jgi:hypothetical protein
MRAFRLSGVRNNRRNNNDKFLRYAVEMSAMDRLALSLDATAPTPAESGVAGDQVAGTPTDVNTHVAPPLEGQFLERAFLGLVANRPKNFGGDLHAPMIGAMINNLSHEKEMAKHQASELQTQLNALNAQLHTKEIQIVKLEVQLSEGRITNIIQKVCTFLSPVAVSIAIDLYKSNFAPAAALVAGLGALLLFTNFIPKRGAR